MRYSIMLLALAAAGCAGDAERADDASRTVERCADADCFQPRDVRDVEVIDDENLVVYTGARECPFRVQVRGFACRLDFALDVNFVQRDPGPVSRSQALGPRERLRTPQRVCPFTPRLEVFTGIYDSAREEGFGGEPEPFGEACRVVDVRSLTDDELLELYVNRGLVPPPPPIGGGRLEMPEQDPAAGEDGGETETPAGAPSNSAAEPEPAGAPVEEGAGAPAP